MEFRKSIQVPAWDEACEQKVMAFWQGRGFRFTASHCDMLQGKRGSYWGNFTSFDMSKLLANLTVSRTGPTEILCILSINTVGQDITPWNRAYFQLEMDTLESWLLYGDRKEAIWSEFARAERQARLHWAVNRGYGLTPEIEAMLANGAEHTLLRAADIMPATELLRPSTEAESVPQQEMLRGSNKPDSIIEG